MSSLLSLALPAELPTHHFDDVVALGEGRRHRRLVRWGACCASAREGHALQGPKREMALPAEPGWLEIAFPLRTVAVG